MNILKSKKSPHILTIRDYFIVPNWGQHPFFGKLDPENEWAGWDVNLKSKVAHFIGHTSNPTEGFVGKPKVFLDAVDKYLEEEI